MQKKYHTNRSGFEITGYVMNKANMSSWAKPVATSNRSGFEITGYVMNKTNM